MLVRLVVPSSTIPFYHCWRARLGLVPPAALVTLSAAEQVRHGRFLAVGPAQAYAGAHLFLRAVLSYYVGQPPAVLALDVDARQKPVLTSGPLLWFNLSYRTKWALLAISNQCEVGVDVEEIWPVTGAEDLVCQLFSSAERAVLHAAKGVAWWALFYAIWTRKEAWAKMLGMGITLPFADFSVAQQHDEAVDWLVPGTGQLCNFTVDEGHAAALTCTAPATINWQHFKYPSRQPMAALLFS